MKIVFDATVFRADYSMQGAAWRTFTDGLHVVPSAELYVPEVVLDEAVNGFRENLKEAWADLATAEKEVDRLLGMPRPQADDRDLELPTKEYRERLMRRVREIGGRFLPYPAVEHRKLVQRDLARRKPFNEKGAGYRDALIWETLRELLAKGVERVILVSANTKDFGDAPLLHDDLLKDIEDRRLISLVKSLAALNEELIVPNLKMLEEVRERLESSRAGIFDLATWLETAPIHLLRKHTEDLAQLVAGFPRGVGVALPSEILEAQGLRVLRVLDLTEHEVLVRMEVRLYVKMVLQWRAEEAINHPEVRKLSEGAIDYAVARRDIAAEIRMGVDLVVNHERGEVVSEEVSTLESDHARFDYGGWHAEPQEAEIWAIKAALRRAERDRSTTTEEPTRNQPGA